jgi:hypothetical protein
MDIQQKTPESQIFIAMFMHVLPSLHATCYFLSTGISGSKLEIEEMHARINQSIIVS